MKVLHHGVSRLKELKCKKQKITGLSAYLNQKKNIKYLIQLFIPS